MRHGEESGRRFMDEMMHKVRWCWLFLFSLLAGCQSQSPVDALPDVSQTLEAAGRRLSGSLSEAKLTTSFLASLGRSSECSIALSAMLSAGAT